MTVFAHRRPNFFDNDQMIGFIDFNSYEPDDKEIHDVWKAAEVATGKGITVNYSYDNFNSEGEFDNCWVITNFDTNAVDNYQIATVSYTDNNIEYQYAAGTTEKDTGKQKQSFILPVQSGSSLSWSSYEYNNKNYQNPFCIYRKFKELKYVDSEGLHIADSEGIYDSEGNLKYAYAGKIGFIGKDITSSMPLGNPGGTKTNKTTWYDNDNEFTPGTLRQFKSRVFFIPVKEDCWLYIKTQNKCLLLSNKPGPSLNKWHYPNINNIEDWVMPFNIRQKKKASGNYYDGGEYIADTNPIGWSKNEMTISKQYSGVLIPLKKGQSFGLACWNSDSRYNIEYKLYKMDYSWNHRVTYVDFDNIIYKPTQILPPLTQVKVGKTTTYEFSYVAPCDCWAYLGSQGYRAESWKIDGNEVLSNSLGSGYYGIRACRFVPLKTGQTLTYSSSKTNSQYTDWSTSNSPIIRFAVYGMKPIIE